MSTAGAGTHTFAANQRVYAGMFKDNKPAHQAQFNEIKDMPARGSGGAWSLVEETLLYGVSVLIRNSCSFSCYWISR
jgi:hypothetical protein